ncbi:hypothetical protein Back2_24360 [Nocardioides baekrokdamisoli]|uniref:Solute-binding protein family 3/N-terminal domain-containing protein n=1 Tax=Nocardioides baekrokdamisoli TaxID=1804624 RepID=A0A3G9J574_9ACTN|nr:transporter substrate-binding domain-containing protein [Nocardioides baekrokdamisoli]BBH18149.1 hypothetical protein Back2_24360 [Nocardioides baekrokdamisoli]
MRRLSLAVSATAASLALAACGSNSLTNTAPSASATVTTSVDAAAAALLPPAVKAKGTLLVGMDTTYPPVDALAGDGQTAVGLDVDLFNAVAKTLGLTATYQTAKFDSIIDGVGSGKYDVGVSAFSITDARKKQAHMVSYFMAGTEWAAPVGNPKHIDVKSPCGISVAVQTGTTEALQDLPPKVAACEKLGKPLHVDHYDAQTAANAAVISGKDDAMLADSPITAYAVKQSTGKLQTIGTIYGSAHYGFVVSLPNTALANAFAAALKVMYENGTYTKVLEAWGATQGGIKSFAVDPAVQ